MSVAVFSDFDGTITKRDCNDALVEAFLGADRHRAYDRMLVQRKISDPNLWQLLDLSLSACGVPLEVAIAHLLATVQLDSGFAAFHAWCQVEKISLEIVSAGAFEIVTSFLAAAGLPVPVTANRAIRRPDGFGLAPLDADCPTGVDKGAILAAARARGDYVVFIGDGISDRGAAPEADLVYAKTSLAVFCRARSISFVPYETFADVQNDLTRRLLKGAP